MANYDISKASQLAKYGHTTPGSYPKRPQKVAKHGQLIKILVKASELAKGGQRCPVSDGR